MNAVRGWVVLFVATLGFGCAHTPIAPRPSQEGRATSPLGSSYLLVPVPSEESAVLGRILPAPPEPGVTLEEIARPNPCGSLLSAPQQTPAASTFEDAQELSQGVQGKAILGSFGFSAAASHSTHFVYKLQTEKRIATFDTNEYVQCCASNDCGYGFVSALIYGDAEYVAGEETTASAGVDFIYAGASGDTRIKALQRRKARGWMAALVTVTNRAQHVDLSPVGGKPIAGISETTLPQQVQTLYKAEKLKVEDKGHYYGVRDGRGNGISENELVRRFRNVSGSNELDDFEHSRNGSALFWTSAGIVAGGAAATVGAYMLAQPVPEGSGDEGAGPMAGGAMLLALGSTLSLTSFVFLIEALGDDGSYGEHDLSLYDARLYVERHNRALLRKTVRDVNRHSEQDRASVQVSLGAGSLAVDGRF